jgi:hypothetical protein
MNRLEAQALLTIFALNCDRTPPESLLDVWAATLDDVPFDLGKAAAIELVKTSPYFPKVAELRDRARLVKEARERERNRDRQLEARTAERVQSNRTGAKMIAHVLGRLKDAGQDANAGHWLGKDRAVAVCEKAVEEWLDLTRDIPTQPARVEMRACAGCYTPTDHPTGRCPRCQPLVAEPTAETPSRR